MRTHSTRFRLTALLLAAPFALLPFCPTSISSMVLPVHAQSAAAAPQRRRERGGAAELLPTYQAVVRRSETVDLQLSRAVTV